MRTPNQHYTSIGLALFIILLCTQFVIAADFSARATSGTISACSCSVIEQNILITNLEPAGESVTYEYNGDSNIYSDSQPVVSTFRLKQTGDFAKWSTIYPESLMLASGETKEIAEFINIPCGISGTYQLITSIESGNTVKEIRQTIDSKICDNIAITGQNQAFQSCSCKPQIITFNVTNSGNFQDVYSISVDIPDELKNSLSINQISFELNAGEVFPVYLYVNTQCEVMGDYNFNVIVSSQSKTYNKIIPVSLELNTCYDYDVIAGKLSTKSEIGKTKFVSHEGSYSLCEGTEMVMPFKILNNGQAKSNYQFELKGVEWAALSYAEIKNVSQNTSYNSYITILPPQNSKGNFTLVLEVKENQAIASIYKIPLEVYLCKTASITNEDHKTIPFNQTIIPFTIQNIGQQEAKYNLSVQGPSWVSIVKYVNNSGQSFSLGTPKEYLTPVRQVSLLPQESASFFLRATPINETGIFDVNITATTSGSLPYVSNIKITVGSGGSSAIITFFIDYALYILLGLILLIILLIIGFRLSKSQVDEKEDEIYLEKEPEIEHRTVIADKTEFESITTSESTINSTEFYTEGPKEKTETNIPWSKVFKYMAYIILILLLLFIFWKAWSSFEPSKPTNTTNETIINSNITINNETEVPDNTINIKENKSSASENKTQWDSVKRYFKNLFGPEDDKSFDLTNCTLTWETNTKYTINLSHSFKDPDNDKLFFYYNIPSKHVNITIDGETAIFNPETDFIGKDSIEFTADDRKGGKIESGQLSLCIVSKSDRKKSFFGKVFESISIYKYYIIAGFIILAVFIIVMNRMEKKPEEKTEEKPTKKKGKKKKK